MQQHDFTVKRDYPIACKRFSPQDSVTERVILGVHGFGGSKESGALTKLAQAMSEDRTTLICFDLPAHGQSEADESHLTVADAKADLLAMIDYTEHAYPHADKTIFATSFGGFLTLLCAERLVGWRVVLRAPAVTMPRILLSNVLRLTDEQFSQLGEVVCPFERPIRLRYSCYRDLLSYGEAAFLPQRPMLIVHGDADEIVPLEHIKAYVQLHPQARLSVIEGANHRFQAEGTLDRAIALAKQYILSDKDEQEDVV